MPKLKYIALGIISFFILFPFAFLLVMSLGVSWPYPALFPEKLSFSNWNKVMGSESGILLSLVKSILISFSVAACSTLAGFWGSRALFRHTAKNTLTLLAYFPYILSPVVFAACFSFYFIRLGLFGNALGVITAQFLITYPFAIIFFGSFWNEKISSYEALTVTLGGNKLQTFGKVLLPLAKGMLIICFFQTFLLSWFEYGLTSIIGLGKIQTLTIKVFMYIKEANYFYGALSSCLLVLPPVILLYLNKKYIFKSLI